MESLRLFCNTAAALKIESTFCWNAILNSALGFKEKLNKSFFVWSVKLNFEAENFSPIIILIIVVVDVDGKFCEFSLWWIAP